ncbi:DUF4439 domain-containing protein [uncultured Corynebacterium sp.]|uniref:DUF4439 domain-containing protein n=1 Tax=uncultured Corynebacterium sp. TaxID=159447 RepID=UPI0025E4E2E5|nr:DUF4439 domain-containing protein [uncultured Corynebacterium sp.]
MNHPLPSLTRRSFLVAAGVGGALTFAAAGCAPIARPSADPVVDAARALALRDASLLDDGSGAGSGLSDVRSTHADALAREVARACGTLEDGSAPEECVAAPTELPAPPAAGSDSTTVLADSRGAAPLLEALEGGGALRDPYEAVLVAAVDGGIVLASRALDVDWDDLVPAADGIELSDDDAQLFADALVAEYGLIYGMGVAAPRIEATLRESTSTSADRHRLLRDRVVAALDDAEVDVPLADAGYSVADGAPTPEENPGEFCAALEDAAAQAWREALVNVEDPAARAFALQAAGLSQAGAAVFRGDGAAVLPGAPA